jgi:hypothetical protein
MAGPAMPTPLVTCALLLAVLAQDPSAPKQPLESGAGAAYGTPEPIDLWDLSAGVRSRHAVRTKGIFSHLEDRGGRKYYELRENGGRVVIILAGEMEGADVDRLLGRRVEVVGLVRQLHDRQGTCQISPTQVAPQSYCDNPDLPPTPDLMGSDGSGGRQGWPRVSVTIWTLLDITPFQREAEAADLEAALDAPPGQRISVYGQFGGANLDRDVPAAAPEPKAWVLRSKGQAIWVLGKEPRGKGFSLDSAYRGDLGKWLTVEGRVTTCGAVRCLKATKVSLSAAPKPPEVE